LGTSFVALYRGKTIATAKLVATSADPTLVADVAARVLAARDRVEDDPVLGPLERGRRVALRVIGREARSDEGTEE
jgi:hypothetical protein